MVESAYANATEALLELGRIQDAIDNEDGLLAQERFEAFMQSWNGEPAELQAEVDRIEQQLTEE